MSGRSGWMWVSLGLACLLVVAVYFAAYYYMESVNYRQLYERAAADLKRLTMPVNILIDYGNGTKIWYNETLVPRESTLLGATEIVAKVDYYTTKDGSFVTHINGVGGESNRYWIWYIWNSTENSWSWGPVACDRYILKEGDTVAWRYEQF